MGWWDASVMGGDTPMDWEGDLCDRAGGHFDDDEGHVYTRGQLEAKLPELATHAASDQDDSHIALQVLGVMALKVGAALSDAVKALIIKAAETDPWALEDNRERKAHMQDLIERVRAHEPGQKTEVPSKGLIEVACRQLDAEKFGPVRVGVAVLLRRNGKGALMGLRKGAHGADTWSFPGGHLEWKESVTGCASRELLEETGIYIAPEKFRKLTFTNDIFERDVKHYITLYVEADWDGDVEPRVMEPTKCGGWEWMGKAPPLDKLFLPIQNLLKEHHPGLSIWA